MAKKTKSGIILPETSGTGLIIGEKETPKKQEEPTFEDNVEMICNILNAMMDASGSEVLSTINGKTEEAVRFQGIRDKGSKLLAQILLAYMDGEKQK